MSQCEQVLDVEAMATSGVYRPDVPDPDMSFASSTSLWELADLRVGVSVRSSRLQREGGREGLSSHSPMLLNVVVQLHTWCCVFTRSVSVELCLYCTKLTPILTLSLSYYLLLFYESSLFVHTGFFFFFFFFPQLMVSFALLVQMHLV